MKQIPNFITVLRILIVPFVVWSLLFTDNFTALILFAIAGVSDGLDGYLAKTFNWQTRFGGIADPLSDKFLMIATFITLTYLNYIPLWMLIIVCVRDIIIVSGALLYHYLIGPFDAEPSIISKMNTVLQVLLVVLILIELNYTLISHQLIEIVLLLLLLTTIISLVHYMWTWGLRAYDEVKVKEIR